MSGAQAHERLTSALKDSVSELLDIVVDTVAEGVTSRLPHVVDAFMGTGDVAEWEAGLQDAVQDSLISMALLMEAKKHGMDLRTAARELSARVQGITEEIE